MSTFPIRILAERTGVPPSTIRAWERRYGILQTQRTPSGHRHYSDEDVMFVKRLQAHLDQGSSISRAIRELDNWQTNENLHQSQLQVSQQQKWQHLIDKLLHAIGRFDDLQLDITYQQALALYDVDIVTEQILRPTLVILGARWKKGTASIAEEHFFSTYMRNKIGARLHHSARNKGPILVIACVPGEHHELGSLMFALSAQNAGYRLLLLGANLPLDQVLPAVNKAQAAGVVLSLVTRPPDTALANALDELAEVAKVPIMLGGVAHGDMTTSSVHLLGGNFSLALQRLFDLVPLR